MTAPTRPSHTEALTEASRGVHHLAGEVDTIRSRAVALLGPVGSAPRSLLGSRFTPMNPSPGLIATAVVSFVVMALLAVVLSIRKLDGLRIPAPSHKTQEQGPARLNGSTNGLAHFG